MKNKKEIIGDNESWVIVDPQDFFTTRKMNAEVPHISGNFRWVWLALYLKLHFFPLEKRTQQDVGMNGTATSSTH